MPDPVYYAPSTILSSPPKPSTTGAYENSIEQAFSDNNGLQQMYKDLLNNIQSNPLKQETYNPLTYAQSPDVTAAIGNLSDLSKNGGYTDQGIADIRARGISPIRAVYANAQRELSRSKGLAGGYSPNFAAVTAKLAREQSQQVSQATQNVNAGIAQNQASNRLSAAPTFASAAGSEESKQQNIDAQNEANRLHVQDANNATTNAQSGNQLNVLDALKSLYGTTPALASTFGSQALGAANINASNARASVGSSTPNNGSQGGGAMTVAPSIYGGDTGRGPNYNLPYQPINSAFYGG